MTLRSLVTSGVDPLTSAYDAFTDPRWACVTRTLHRQQEKNMRQKLLQNLLFAAIAAWGLYLTQGVMGDAPLGAQSERVNTAMLAMR